MQLYALSKSSVGRIERSSRKPLKLAQKQGGYTLFEARLLTTEIENKMEHLKADFEIVKNRDLQTS